MLASWEHLGYEISTHTFQGSEIWSMTAKCQPSWSCKLSQSLNKLFFLKKKRHELLCFIIPNKHAKQLKKLCWIRNNTGCQFTHAKGFLVPLSLLWLPKPMMVGLSFQQVWNEESGRKLYVFGFFHWQISPYIFLTLLTPIMSCLIMSGQATSHNIVENSSKKSRGLGVCVEPQRNSSWIYSFCGHGY